MPLPGTDQRTLAYAAGASLAAVTLVYVFGPTWLIDSASSSSAQRKNGVVGLANPANDCFINSILQALAGLDDLRSYLVQRTRSAKQNGELRSSGYTAEGKPFLTAALKEILDSLNERPLYRKTISNRPFLSVMERLFRQKISRAQQDAHEFLQVVAETLAEEYHRRRKEETKSDEDEELASTGGDRIEAAVTEALPNSVEIGLSVSGESSCIEEIGRMPLEGTLRSEIECLKCQFKPKPTVSSFVVLTLPVPQKNSTSLADCIDNTLSTEYIDDFQCAKCRLEHAITYFERKLTNTTSPVTQKELEDTLLKVRNSIDTDPEKVPEGIDIPPLKEAPTSRIAKRTMMELYPDIITFHLSRSIYETFSSRKNSAKVSFPEDLQMGGLMDRKGYRLICVVTHKGGHESGHYECFRRQVVHRAPYATSTPAPSAPATPVPSTPLNRSTVMLVEPEMTNAAPDRLSCEIGSSSSRPTSIATSSPSEAKTTPPSSICVPSETEKSKLDVASFKSHKSKKRKFRKKHGNDRWWRISDDKIKEARTQNLLDMQKEVYLLFYQRIKDDE